MAKERLTKIKLPDSKCSREQKFKNRIVLYVKKQLFWMQIHVDSMNLEPLKITKKVNG